MIQYNLDGDVRALSELAAGLIPYLYENELYGAMPVNMPRLTVGGVLMRLHRLEAIRDLLNPEQTRRLDEARAAFDKARAEWPVAYEGKLDRELTARTQALGNIFNDCKDSLRRCADIYPSEIEKRVMAEQLASEERERKTLTPVQEAALRGFDAGIKQFIEPGEFLWDPRLKAAYPEDAYWYLYRRVLRPQDGRG